MKKLRNNQTITVVQTSSEEVTTFVCIKHKNYLRNKSHYDKYRDPCNFSEIMNGSYLIIDSPNATHWDTFICDQLLSDKPYQGFEIIKTIEIQNEDIITYKKTNRPNSPVFQLTFRTFNDCKNCKKKDGIYYIPNVKKHTSIQMPTLFDALNHCYIGKTVKHMQNNYYIVGVEKPLKNRRKQFLTNIVKSVQNVFSFFKNY